LLIGSHFGNNESFGFNLEIEISCTLKELFISLGGEDHLHLSDIDVWSGGSSTSLRHFPDIHVEQSSVEFSDGYEYSFQNWSEGNCNFFSTKYQKKPFIRIVFADALQISGIDIKNRVDGLWDRARTLKVEVVSEQSSRMVIWDATNVECVRKRLLRILGELSISLNGAAAERMGFTHSLERSVAFLIERAEQSELISGDAFSQDCALAITSAVFWNYLKNILDGDNSVLEFDLKPCAKLLDFYELPYSNLPVLSIIAYLLGKGKNLEAFRFFRRVVRRGFYPDAAILKMVLKKVGMAAYGYPLVLTAHSFLRALNSYAEVDLREFIHKVTNILKDEGFGEAMICYGTLLGAVRDNDFIEHDDDMDILLIPNEGVDANHSLVEAIVNAAEKNGCRALLNSPNEIGALPIIQISHVSYPAYIDIFLAVPMGDQVKMVMRNCRNELVERDILIPPSRLEEGYFAGFTVPHRPEAFFELRYGPNWRVPDPLFRLMEN
jgi:hypothetical protein